MLVNFFYRTAFSASDQQIGQAFTAHSTANGYVFLYYKIREIISLRRKIQRGLYKPLCLWQQLFYIQWQKSRRRSFGVLSSTRSGQGVLFKVRFCSRLVRPPEIAVMRAALTFSFPAFFVHGSFITINNRLKNWAPV